jgi:hypothetical protein
MWSARAGFPPGTRAQKTRFWRPTTRSGWAPFFFLAPHHASAQSGSAQAAARGQRALVHFFALMEKHGWFSSKQRYLKALLS